MKTKSRQEITDAFEMCDFNNDGKNCHKCPYRDTRWNGAWIDENDFKCWQELVNDILKLLKENIND